MNSSIKSKRYFLAIAALTVGALCLVYALPALAARYENARFGYSVDVPNDFDWLPESVNGDGRVFGHKADPRFTITFYARIQQDDGEDTLAHEGAANIPAGASNTSETASGPSYQVSFVKGGMYGEALIFLVDEVFYAAIATWPVAENRRFKPVAAEVLRTWKIPGNPAAPAASDTQNRQSEKTSLLVAATGAVLLGTWRRVEEQRPPVEKIRMTFKADGMAVLEDLLVGGDQTETVTWRADGKTLRFLGVQFLGKQDAEFAFAYKIEGDSLSLRPVGDGDQAENKDMFFTRVKSGDKP